MNISKGMIVSVSYLIRDASNQIIECNEIPITYPHRGEHELFSQIEDALEGQKAGDCITINLKAADAFGPHDPGLTFTDKLKNTPEDIRYIGAEFAAENVEGKALEFRVTRIEDGEITIDANHIMAGKDLTFEVTVTEVRLPTKEELTGQKTVN